MSKEGSTAVTGYLALVEGSRFGHTCVVHGELIPVDYSAPPSATFDKSVLYGRIIGSFGVGTDRYSADEKVITEKPQFK